MAAQNWRSGRQDTPAVPPASGYMPGAVPRLPPADVSRPDAARIGLGGATGRIVRPVAPPLNGILLVLCLGRGLCLFLEFLLEFSLG
jgi:hypothetical protein